MAIYFFSLFCSVPDFVVTDVNSPVFSLTVVDGNKTIQGSLQEGLKLDFKQLEPQNHSSPQCVYWKFTHTRYGI